MLVVDRAHQLRRWWEYFIDEDKDSLLWCKLNPFPYDVHELPDGEVLYDHDAQDKHQQENSRVYLKHTQGTRYFFLSIVGISVRSAFSQMT